MPLFGKVIKFLWGASSTPKQSSQLVTTGCNWLQLASGSGYNWLQLVATGYNWLQLVATGYNWLQLVTTGYNWLQVVR